MGYKSGILYFLKVLFIEEKGEEKSHIAVGDNSFFPELHLIGNAFI